MLYWMLAVFLMAFGFGILSGSLLDIKKITLGICGLSLLSISYVLILSQGLIYNYEVGKEIQVVNKIEEKAGEIWILKDGESSYRMGKWRDNDKDFALRNHPDFRVMAEVRADYYILYVEKK